MLGREVMGALALGILWINTLLIAAAALQDLLALSRRRAQMKAASGEGVGLLSGRVERGRGEGGALAAHRIEQVGRAADSDQRVILFADRSAEGEVFGGVVALDGGGSLSVPATREGEVWVDQATLVRAGECPSDEAFNALYEGARKARGASRTVSAAIEVGREVFLFGHARAKGGGLLLEPASEGGMLIAAFDPRRWIDGKVRLLAVFIAAELAAAAGCTLLAFYPPIFGLVSKIGGALCLGFFLLVQPAGTMVREAARTPSRALLRGRWAGQRPDAADALARVRQR